MSKNLAGVYAAYVKKHNRIPTSGKLYDWGVANGKIIVVDRKVRRTKRSKLQINIDEVDKGYQSVKKKIERECKAKRKLADKVKEKAIKKVEKEYKVKKKE